MSALSSDHYRRVSYRNLLKESDMLQRTNLIFRSPTLVLLCIIFWVAVARPQGRCEAELSKAEQAYSQGFFDQVIDEIKSCLNKGDLTTAEQAWAYKLLGQAYISKNEAHLAGFGAEAARSGS
jgi:hypothetical protein